MKKPHIGFVGLGAMGLPMLVNILKHHNAGGAGGQVQSTSSGGGNAGGGGNAHVTAFDSSDVAQKKVHATCQGLGLDVRNFTFASSLNQVVRTSDVVITMLPSPESCKAVYDEMLNNEDVKTSLFIDCSTNDPNTARQIADKVNQAKLAPTSNAILEASNPVYVDAPVSGGVTAAAAGTLTFMLGADSEIAAKAAKPVLSTMGSRVITVGNTVGAGCAAKLCNNLVLAVSMAGVSEALALGERLGLRADELSDVINASSGRCWSSDTYNPAPGVQRDANSGELAGVPSNLAYDGGFALRLMLKDIRLANEVAEDGSLPMAHVAEKLYEHTASIVGENKDFSSVFDVVYGGAGVKE
ncbi:hypothetical protein PPROV_000270400 [Pycnococcus provasolii]|uniref:3-hydroxyisobutyrate dehydrogenase n=2 Tax=Pycnococcus provasolii TaxID=41880 RepID=A0A830HDQ0_9CHLO|nr:hypothetical protein PPROV_000270400 [Pycnococcus provasolii]